MSLYVRTSVKARPLRLNLSPSGINVSADHRDERFIETGRVPGDAAIAGRTWWFVNKNGGPDRRFKDNARLPITRYGWRSAAVPVCTCCGRSPEPTRHNDWQAPSWRCGDDPPGRSAVFLRHPRRSLGSKRFLVAGAHGT